MNKLANELQHKTTAWLMIAVLVVFSVAAISPKYASAESSSDENQTCETALKIHKPVYKRLKKVYEERNTNFVAVFNHLDSLRLHRIATGGNVTEVWTAIVNMHTILNDFNHNFLNYQTAFKDLKHNLCDDTESGVVVNLNRIRFTRIATVYSSIDTHNMYVNDVAVLFQ